MQEPPSPLKKDFPRINEPMPVQAGTSSTYLLTKKVPELSSSAMERIKSVVEALSVELGVDMQLLLLTITEVFGGGGLGNMEHGGPLADRPLRTRETQQALDDVLISDELPVGYHDRRGKRKVPDEGHEARSARKKRKTLGRATSVDRVFRYGGTVEGFTPQDIGSVPVTYGQPQGSTFGHAHWQAEHHSSHLVPSSSCQLDIPSEISSPRDAWKLSAADVTTSPWTYYNTSIQIEDLRADNSQYVESGSSGQGGPAERFAPQGIGRTPSRQLMGNLNMPAMDPPLPPAQNGMASFWEYQSHDYSEHLPDNDNIPPYFAMDAICRSSIPSQELPGPYVDVLSSSILSEMMPVTVPNGGYASNMYPSLHYCGDHPHDHTKSVSNTGTLSHATQACPCQCLPCHQNKTADSGYIFNRPSQFPSPA